MKPKHKEIATQVFKLSSYMRKCPMCGLVIDLGQPIPLECALLSLTSPFRNSKGWDEYSTSGLCQDCQDTKYGKVD